MLHPGERTRGRESAGFGQWRRGNVLCRLVLQGEGEQATGKTCIPSPGPASTVIANYQSACTWGIYSEVGADEMLAWT
jgi:hypothetical protein